MFRFILKQIKIHVLSILSDELVWNSDHELIYEYDGLQSAFDIS